MADEPNWEDIFTPRPELEPESAPPVADSEPKSRRELRESEGRSRKSTVGRPPKKKHRLTWLWVLLSVFVLIAGAGTFVWFQFEDQVRSVLGWEEPIDFVGPGTDEGIVVVIQAGDIGEDVARTLLDSGVTMTFTAFYELLLAQDPPKEFQPGNYSLRAQMSAQSALDALLNPENKITDRVTIPEGTTLPGALALLSEATGVPLADYEAAAADYASFGVPAEAPSLEGYLFPATYPLDPGQDPHAVLQLLVTEMVNRLDAAGVVPEDRHRVLTMAALIQRESGPNTDDFYKISRVFQNRLDNGWHLESDATVAYGTGNLHTVWTTDAERADASNLYNTYANLGLPIGPIGLPGELAINAALHPADGPWFFFVPINLATGETVFTETVAEHEAAAAQLRVWCRESDENASYCG